MEICLWLLFFRGDDNYLNFKDIKPQKGGGTTKHGYTPTSQPSQLRHIHWQGSKCKYPKGKIVTTTEKKKRRVKRRRCPSHKSLSGPAWCRRQNTAQYKFSSSPLYHDALHSFNSEGYSVMKEHKDEYYITLRKTSYKTTCRF